MNNKIYTQDKVWNKCLQYLIWGFIGSFIFIMGIGFSLGQTNFTAPSPEFNSTINTTLVSLNVSTDLVCDDFYYIINNNTDGTEQLIPIDSYSIEYETTEGENLVKAVCIYNGANETTELVFYVNTSFSKIEEEPTNPPAIIDTQSHSSAGGGGCSTKWTCTNWSECNSNLIQTRLCSYKTNYCKPTILKPNETQICNYVAPINVEEQINNLSKKLNVTKENIEEDNSMSLKDWEIFLLAVKFLLAVNILIIVIVLINYRRKNESKNISGNIESSTSN